MRFLRLIALMMLITVSLIPVSSEAANLSYQSKILPNGIRFVYRVLPQVKTAAARVIIPTGYLDEPRQSRGISHLLEHAVYRGNEKYSARDFHNLIYDQGGTFNGLTTLNRTEFSLEVPSTNLISGLTVYLDLILNPGLAEPDLRLEKNIINVERTLSGAGVNAFFLYFNEITQQQFDSSVSSISRESLLQYHQDHYKTGLLTVIVTGSFNPDQVIKFLASLPKNSVSDEQSNFWLSHENTGNVVLNDYLLGEKYQLLLGYDLKGLSEDKGSLTVAKTLPFILDESRLYDYLKDRPLDYQVFLSRIADRYYLVFVYRDCREHYSLELNNWHQKNMQRFFKYLKTNSFDKFLKWRSQSLENQLETLEMDPAALNMFYARTLFEPSAMTVEDIKAMRSVSSKEIKAFVQKYLDGKNYQKVVVKAL